MKLFEIKYQRYKQTFTTWERNDWTGRMERDDWNLRYYLCREFFMLGVRVFKVTIVEEMMPKYAQAAWGALGSTDWFEKHSLVEARFKELEGKKLILSLAVVSA